MHFARAASHLKQNVSAFVLRPYTWFAIRLVAMPASPWGPSPIGKVRSMCWVSPGLTSPALREDFAYSERDKMRNRGETGQGEFADMKTREKLKVPLETVGGWYLFC